MKDNYLIDEILQYWWECVDSSIKQDFQVNDFIKDFVISHGHAFEGYELDRDIKNLTKAERRRLLKALYDSGIKEGKA